MKRIEEFVGGDRYRYDFNVCTTGKGYAQFDTREDASYYGNWINPFNRNFVSFIEGDLICITCESDKEFVTEVKRQIKWHMKNTGFIDIDPGFNDNLKEKLENLGLGYEDIKKIKEEI